MTAEYSARVGFTCQSWIMVDDAVRAGFAGTSGYLNTAAVGIPPRTAVAVLRNHLDDWATGSCDPASFDRAVDRARRAFGGLVGVDPPEVALTSCVSAVSGLVAMSMPEGAHVLCAEEDFTSVLFPFLVDQRLDVKMVPLERLIESISDDTALVAVSAVQSADGRIIDLNALVDAAAAHDSRTYLDITQAAGWLPLGAHRFDVTACGAYKWLLSPRGTGFMTVRSRCDWPIPRLAGWYSGSDPWKSIYGPPLRLAADARRFNLSPPWFDIAASAESLEFLQRVGVDAINMHSVGLANRLRDRIGLPPSDSAIVAVETDRGQALESAGIAASTRAGRVRLSFYLYNTAADVDLAANILAT